MRPEGARDAPHVSDPFLGPHGRRAQCFARARKAGWFQGREPSAEPGSAGREPKAVSGVRFEEHVRRALDELPPQLAKALENVAVVVEEEAPGDPDLFGLWESAEYLPDKITIFRKPLVEAFPDPQELEKEIRITVLHELAHYFGLDEDRLEDLGYS